MYQEFYRGSELLHLPLFTLLFFVSVFFAVVLWLFVFRRKDPKFDELAAMPLLQERTEGAIDE